MGGRQVAASRQPPNWRPTPGVRARHAHGAPIPASRCCVSTPTTPRGSVVRQRCMLRLSREEILAVASPCTEPRQGPSALLRTR